MENNYKNKLWIIGIIIAILLIFYSAYGVYLIIKADKICQNECNAYEGLHYQRISNGKMNTNDLCICYFEDSIKTWRIGKILD